MMATRNLFSSGTFQTNLCLLTDVLRLVLRTTPACRGWVLISGVLDATQEQLLAGAAELIRAYASAYPILLCQCNGQWKWAKLEDVSATVSSEADLEQEFTNALLLPLDFVSISGFKTLHVKMHDKLVSTLAGSVLKLPTLEEQRRTRCGQGRLGPLHDSWP